MRLQLAGGWCTAFQQGPGAPQFTHDVKTRTGIALVEHDRFEVAIDIPTLTMSGLPCMCSFRCGLVGGVPQAEGPRQSTHGGRASPQFLLIIRPDIVMTMRTTTHLRGDQEKKTSTSWCVENA